MFKRLSTDTVNAIIIIGVLLLILEISFFNSGFFFSALFSFLFIYIGWKNFTQLWGKVFFWIGLISVIVSILNMFAIRFIIVVCLVLAILHYSRSKDEVIHVKPTIYITDNKEAESVVQMKPLLSSKLFGDQQTAETAYSWSDINIQGGFGNRVIDLSNTVLPNDTAVISIRHLIGNIEIYVPYEVEVSIHHSTVYGKAHVLGNDYPNLINKSLSFQTEKYEEKRAKVKVITTLITGDIEVKRI